MSPCLGFLPISMVLLASGTFIISYIIAVVRGDVSAAFPYISDTGAEGPESKVFAQFLNISSFLALWTMYVRYKIIICLGSGEDRWLRNMNRFSFVLGVLAALGCSMVANFQERTEVEAVHFTGAFMVFIGGFIYTCLMTAITYHMYPDYNGLYIGRIRLAISVVCLVSLIITGVGAGIANYQSTGSFHRHSEFHWNPGDDGYAAHVTSTAGEWSMALTFLFFFFTYVREFNKFDLSVRLQALVRHMDEEPLVVQLGSDERTALLH
ncbi:DNA damage-regulated autophagy modulator protein 2-like [Gigantopelta aegis]|uniref:DNA damage-regulated autophagy modulator protein 2-like n=1 Tax=Gigantopelta aegis TaxID=1735272 RepID=UPI001B88E64F|nr:DNA damage-regulated autophagy modulator protein 2-like [Gigantopelta aegis]